MDIPDLVKGALGDEEIQAGVSLGDEDAVCLTPTRTLVYRGEGLLSDEQVEEYSHDIEALGVSEGRRKTKFTMQYIDGTESFTVPANRGDKVLGLFLEGVLRLDGVIEPRESIAGVYRFSELTLIIAEQRLIKHIGNQVWTEDFEVYDYDDVTGLEFERASVATSIALTVNGRPQRVKVPNDNAPVVRQTLEEALFGYYDVGSIDELNRIVGGDDGVDAGGVEQTDDSDDGFSFGDDFDPLVSDEEEELIEPVDADRPEQGAASGEPAGAQQPRGGESAGPASEPTPDQSAGAAADQPNAGADPSANASSGTGGEPGRGGSGSSNTPEQPQSAGSGQQSPEQAQQRSETGHSQPNRGQQQSEPDTQQTEPAQQQTDPAQQQPSGGNQQPSEPTQERSASSGQQRSASSGQRQSSSPGNAATSSSSEQHQSESRSEQPDRSGQDSTSTSTATKSQTAAGTPDRTVEPKQDEQPSSTATSADSSTGEGITREEYEALAERVEELTDAVDRQNELLKRQHRALKKLVQRDQQPE
ncbi:DUF7115 domain-containing protein [Halosimplex sp. J119]